MLLLHLKMGCLSTKPSPTERHQRSLKLPEERSKYCEYTGVHPCDISNVKTLENTS